jgi:heme-degrading monooxygenase HmoA
MIKRIVKLTFQEDKTDDFIQIFEESKDKIRAMSGCQHVEMLRAVEPDNVFFTFSIWDSEVHLNAYRNSELFGSTWKKTKALFSDAPQAWTVDLLSQNT